MTSPSLITEGDAAGAYGLLATRQVADRTTAAQLDGDGPLTPRLRDTRVLTVITSASARGSTRMSIR